MPAGRDATQGERRRPGRLRDVSPELLPLLRTAGDAPEPDTVESVSDGLSPARGIAIGILLAVPVWGVVALLVWWWLR